MHVCTMNHYIRLIESWVSASACLISNDTGKGE